MSTDINAGLDMETVATLLHKRDGLVKDRATKSGAGGRAGVTSKIEDVQLDLILAGAIPGSEDQVKSGDAHFTPWENPTGVRSSLTPISEDSLVSDIADAFRALSDVKVHRGIDAVRHAADLRITDRLKKSKIREYAIPDPRVKVTEDQVRVWTADEDGYYSLTDREVKVPTTPKK